MRRLTLALATLVVALTAAGAARADYAIIRWNSGDCTIWDNRGFLAVPIGFGWGVVATGLPSYGAARGFLEAMYRRGVCY